MSRRLVAASTAALLAIALAGCTSAPAPSDSPAATPAPSASGSTGSTGSSRLPGCTLITEALGTLLDGLTLDPDLSASQEAQEEYDQRACVFTTADAVTQLGVTIAAIPFQTGELDSFAALPNVIQDTRTEQRGAVLQTFALGDGDDGHLDSALYLFDEQYSVTIQGYAAGGSTLATLPGLTLPAAADAAFAVRDLID